MAASALWLFAHHALARNFGHDPSRFVATLDGNGAVAYLEQAWQWARDNTTQPGAPPKPPLRYAIDRPRPGLAIVRMELSQVTDTGEPYQVRFILRDPDPGATNGYSRVFMLEHDAYASEQAGGPRAIVCETLADGRHRSWAEVLSPDDVDGFDRAVIAIIQRTVSAAAESGPAH